jgi:sporulation protein YlmC with PRC-barrel domain
MSYEIAWRRVTALTAPHFVSRRNNDMREEPGTNKLCRHILLLTLEASSDRAGSGQKNGMETTKESVMKRLLASTAIALMLGLVPALAETPAPTNQTPKDPAMQDRLQPSEPAHILARQEPGEWLATELIGRSVVNTANETIGDVNDLITDANGKTIAAVIGVGGFLGIGEKDVAIRFEDLRFARDGDNDIKVTVNIDKSALALAPDYQSLDEQEVVEGANKSDREDKTTTR